MGISLSINKRICTYCFVSDYNNNNTYYLFAKIIELVPTWTYRRYLYKLWLISVEKKCSTNIFFLTANGLLLFFFFDNVALYTTNYVRCDHYRWWLTFFIFSFFSFPSTFRYVVCMYVQNTNSNRHWHLSVTISNKTAFPRYNCRIPFTHH